MEINKINKIKDLLLETSDNKIFIFEDNKIIYQNKKNIDYIIFNNQLTTLKENNDEKNLFYNVIENKFYKLNIIYNDNTKIMIYEDKTKEINLEIKAKLLEKKANTDKLTGLYNRTKMIDELQKIDNGDDNKNKTFLVMIDLDNFKRINDKYGHPTGDIVLKEISKIFIKHIKKPNIISRYGGEEFTIIFFNKEKKEILEIMENIRKTVEETKINDEISCTISIGITRYKENYVNTLKIADEALYFVKNNGKNGLCYNSNKSKKLEKLINYNITQK